MTDSRLPPPLPPGELGSPREECLDPETLAAYVDARLDAAAAAAVETHLADCARCREWFVDVAAAVRPEYGDLTPARSGDDAAEPPGGRTAGLAPPLRRPWRWQTVVAGLAAAGLLVAAGTAVWQRIAGPGAPVSPVTELALAVGTSRPVEGRLTGGFAYGAYAGPLRTGDGRGAAALPVLAEVDRLRRLAGAAPDDVGLAAAAGVGRLVTGDIDAAVRELEDAAARAPGDARVHTDLAAAYLARSASTDTPADAVRALDAAQRALAADPGRIEAWFNRALALERVGPRAAARRAWEEYLARDASSEWASEARQHLANVSSRAEPAWPGVRRTLERRPLDSGVAARAAAQFAGDVRAHVEDELLVSWAESVLGTGRPCADCLEAAAALAGAILTQRGDATLQDLITGLRRADAAGAAARRRAAVGVRAFAQARAAIADGRIDAAEAALREAEAALASLVGAADGLVFFRGFVDYSLGRVGAAEGAFTQAADLARARRHGYIAGRADMMRSFVATRAARFRQSDALLERAIAAFTASGEDAFAAVALASRGEDRTAQGDTDAAWRYEAAALSLVSDHAPPRLRYVVFSIAGTIAAADRLEHAAAVLDEALSTAVADGDPGIRALSASQLADSLQRAGNAAAADRWLAEAERDVTRVDPGVRAQFETELDQARGRVWSDRNPEAALAALTRHIEGLPGSGSRFRLAEAHLQRGRIHRRLGRADLAEVDWRRGVALLEDQRPGVRDEQLRISHLAQAWDLFGELAALLVDRGDVVEGLRIAERGRARALLDSLAPGQQAAVVDVERLASRLGADTAAVVYLTLPDRLITWVVSQGRTQCVSTATPRATLESLAGRWRDRLTRGEAADGFAERLSRLLVDPVASLLPPGGTLLVVPDGPVAVLPFAALRAGGGLAGDRYALGVLPALSLLEHGRAAEGRTPRQVLAIGDPEVAAWEAGGLPRLPAAAREARAVAALYPRARIATGADATPAALFDGLTSDEVVHFAGHGVANEAFPGRSALLLAPGPEGTGTVSPAQLAAIGHASARLVVLSACSTAAGRVARGEGPLSLARPFLAAGVPTVVAALWPTGDRVNELLLTRFHRHVVEGEDARRALQRAQRWLRETEGGAFDDPRHWAAFVCLGGGPRRA